ncbi:glycine rich domain-containing protein [Clostridioides sp. ZZV15-6598]|uniref:glycine rich domain-containing protein n=1 Tax=Clostridioides sp. ZZV15-6598 TaxID=2811501 RepID=UPI001D0FA7EC|nr:hypothetical protein [Clostridioides sp. ZZV15-6598]
MATIYEFNYANYTQNISLLPGRYKLECYGACGGGKGAGSFGECAKGGYAKGEITLKTRTNLIVCVGQSGYEKLPKGSNITRTGFNGGGRAGTTTIGDYCYSGYGGGATDIRLYYPSATWDSSKGLLSRILVAGGAGAIDGFSYSHPSIGHGGGEKGSDGVSANTNRFSGGGSQYQGGSNQETIEYHGSFGKGGIGYYSVGGGGGWYGGGGINVGDVAGGGSGYALTKDSYKPQGYIPTSEYWLENIVMTTGGNTTKADGHAKITLLQALPFLTISSYNSTTVTFKADHTDPTLLTKIECFIDDILKETITTDLTAKKTINYTLEDNALHTLKIVVTDSSNATVEKVISISKNIMSLGDDASIRDIVSKMSEIKEGLVNGKTAIINILALKNIESSLKTPLVELSEKIKTSFDSSDASVEELQNRITELTNQLSQRAKFATGTFTVTDNKFPITIPTNLNFVPKVVIVRFMTVKDKNGLMINSDTFGNLSNPQYGYATVNGVKKIVFNFSFENISESSFTITGGSNDSVVDFPVTVVNSTLRWYVFDVDIV